MPAETTTSQGIQTVNIANVLAYFGNMAVTYGVGASGKFPTNGEISVKYQTLVTPSGYAFSIWGIIFTTQLIWSIAQLLPRYRAHKLVIHGVAYNYVAVSVAQILWTIFFTTELIFLSLLAMLAILLPLLKILATISSIPHETTGHYWLLKFPFEMHAAWIMAATVVNVNVVPVAWKMSATLLSVYAWLSLFILLAVASYYTLRKQTNWVVPIVLAWASLAVAVELSDPQASIKATFGPETITNVKTGSTLITGFILLVTIAKLLHSLCFKRPQASDSQYDGLEDSTNYGSTLS